MTRAELRIGNLIDRGDYHCKVTGITEDGIMTEPINYEGERFVEQITKPIPLTEEWLVKLNPDKLLLTKDEFGIFIWINGDKLYIKHVHQLQNLYFALTNRELEI
jgi:hypothetical protein